MHTLWRMNRRGALSPLHPYRRLIMPLSLWQRYQYWQSRRLRHARSRKLWKRVRERFSALRYVYRSLSPEWRNCLQEMPEHLDSARNGLFDHLLTMDRLLRALPPDRIVWRLWCTAMASWHSWRRERALESAYRDTLTRFNDDAAQRQRMLNQVYDTERTVETWILELEHLADRLQRMRGPVGQNMDPVDRLREALTGLQDELSSFQSGVKETQELFGR